MVDKWLRYAAIASVAYLIENMIRVALGYPVIAEWLTIRDTLIVVPALCVFLDKLTHKN